MCRKKYLQGCCLLCLGFGLIAGHSMESWLLCCGGGVALICLGLLALHQRTG